MKDNKQNLNNLRHSCTHLLAAAVMELWPLTKRAIGPAIENGFYFDFDFADVKISEADFPKIEEKMHGILKSWKSFARYELSGKDAKKEYPNNPFKEELIDEFSEAGNKPVSFYKSGNYWDLCRGGHVEHPNKELNYFKLLSVAGAYWRGDEKNQMLTRIYGTCWPSQKELEVYLQSLALAKESDHRVIGQKLGLFVFADLVGKGLPLLTAKGAAIRRELERFTVDEEIKRGYQHVVTPPLAKVELYRTSGHYPYYKDTMYPPMIVDEDELILRPMTCPHHFMLYKSEPRSYKQLPIRYAEISPQFRYEKSGELTGLMRVRMFTLADAHIICTLDQVDSEIKGVLELIDFINEKLGLKKGIDYRYRLSLGDRADSKKFFKDDLSWEKAEKVLRQVLTELQAPYYEAPGEAAFYGPKIDVQIKNIAQKEETAFTVQYDFVMPKRFSLEYIDADGKTKQPLVVHRSSLGSIERTMAFLIEKFKGAFPLWLSPVQVVVVPISERHVASARLLQEVLLQKGLRGAIDDRSETMQAKIRDAQLQKVPYVAIIGDKEIADSPTSVSVRNRQGEVKKLSQTEFIFKLIKEIETKV